MISLQLNFVLYLTATRAPSYSSSLTLCHALFKVFNEVATAKWLKVRQFSRLACAHKSRVSSRITVSRKERRKPWNVDLEGGLVVSERRERAGGHSSQPFRLRDATLCCGNN